MIQNTAGITFSRDAKSRIARAGEARVPDGQTGHDAGRRSRGVRVLTSSGDDLTETSDPFKIAMRQIAGVFAQLEKARLVSKLKAARDRKRATGVKVEGRKSYAEMDAAEHGGAMIALARKLRRKSPKAGRRSLREISVELVNAGFISRTGKPYAPTAIGRMLGEIK